MSKRLRVELGNVAVREAHYEAVDVALGHETLVAKANEDGIALVEWCTDASLANLTAAQIETLGTRLPERDEEGRTGFAKSDDRLAAELSGVGHYTRLPGRRVSVIGGPASVSLMEAAAMITEKNKGQWQAMSAAPPAWVESNSPALAMILSEHYDCPIGRPDDWPVSWRDEEPEPPSGGSSGGEPTNPPVGPVAMMLAMLSLVAMFLVSRLQLRTDLGDDFQAEVMGGDGSVGDEGTATATAATTLTNSGASWATNEWRGHIVATKTTYGVIGTNTGQVLTIDKWYNASDPGGAAAATPAVDEFTILPGGAPAWWVGLTETAITPAAGDTELNAELTADGFIRQVGLWGHTAGTSTYTLTNTFTMSGGTTRTLRGAAVFNFSRILNDGQRMVFITAMPNPPVTVPSDSVITTYTVTM